MKTKTPRVNLEYLIEFNGKLIDLNTTVFVLTLRRYTGDGNSLETSYTNEGIFTTPANAEKYAKENGYYELYRTDVLIYDVELNKGVQF